MALGLATTSSRLWAANSRFLGSPKAGVGSGQVHHRRCCWTAGSRRHTLQPTESPMADHGRSYRGTCGQLTSASWPLLHWYACLHACLFGADGMTTLKSRTMVAGWRGSEDQRIRGQGGWSPRRESHAHLVILPPLDILPPPSTPLTSSFSFFIISTTTIISTSTSQSLLYFAALGHLGPHRFCFPSRCCRSHTPTMPHSTAPPPRHDFFQTPQNLTVSLYVKGYAGHPVSVSYHTHRVDVSLPAIPGADANSFSVGPLAGAIVPGECSERILGTKVSPSPPVFSSPCPRRVRYSECFSVRRLGHCISPTRRALDVQCGGEGRGRSAGTDCGLRLSLSLRTPESSSAMHTTVVHRVDCHGVIARCFQRHLRRHIVHVPY